MTPAVSLLWMGGLPLFAYLVGSVAFGAIIARLWGGIDVRSAGSGNIGATNVLRTAGKFAGLLTLACDVMKGAVPVWFALASVGSQGTGAAIYVALVAALAFGGHLFPLYTRFKGGGKGVATAAGCFAVIAPVAVLVALLVFVLSVCITDRASAGSLAAAAVLPLAVWQATGSLPFAGLAVGVGVLIVFRHRENIRRLLTGREPKIR